MAPEKRIDRQLVILVITVVGALLGGLLGISTRTVDPWLWVLALLGGTVIGAGVAFFLLTSDRLTADRPETGGWSLPAERPALSPPAAPRPTWPAVSMPPVLQPNRMRPVAPFGDRPAPEPPPSTEAARLTLPLVAGHAAPSNGTATSQWWAESPSAAAPADRQEPPAGRRSPAPPLSDYDAESALIAQCPRCGEFRLDVHQVAQDYAFTCRNGSCGNTWSWTPGTPWPPVVVRRNLPGGSGTERG
jgi:hypothetical protein